ncbi:MAG: 30S ribosomal protein S1 [Pelagibacterales bacterium]|nr:30S ribosomal protein S1 [Pelagibacterales bacterium]PPR16695.1 MAG: 30S ribosomal protein S1 [Alphaproteobacteria bacterium MarineAlpha9_Bin3]|tara:strand:- start:3660 stop:5504 length:1845 start_codon:yes stop_codon:yes gene_type:complete
MSNKQEQVESFADLFAEQIKKDEKKEGQVVKGTVISIENDMMIVDVGYKTEGRISLREFSNKDNNKMPIEGDVIDVYLEKVENRNGEAVLSREKARREESWGTLEKASEDKEKVNGTIFGRVKGGFSVDLDGAIAFLPGSQVDVRPTRDANHLVGSTQLFHILKMDRRRGNIVVSRRSVLEESRAEAKAELVSTMEEGQILEGIIKNITDYGAFVDLGEVDGLLHVTDISWKRISHPTEALSIGQKVKVQVIKFNSDTQRISLGMKQLEEDPWEIAQNKYNVDDKFTGRVTNITDYGAFVELESGIEGLVHVSEMSWTKKNMQPGKIVSTSEEVEVKVLEIDSEKRRISLGMKQCKPNPWLDLQKNYKIGAEVEGEVKSITEFGIFIGLPGEMDGLIHLSDLDWNTSGEDLIGNFKKGDMIKAKLLEIDIDKERVSLGIKQLTQDPMEDNNKLKKGNVVTSVIKSITEKGLHVEISEGVNGFVKKSELSKERSDQRVDRFAVEEKIDARILSVDSKTREVALSIKALQVAEEKQALKDYGSVDSGASLGDILGAALEEKAKTENKGETTKPKAEKAKPKSQKAKPKKAVKTKAKTTAKKTASKEKKEAKKDDKK